MFEGDNFESFKYCGKRNYKSPEVSCEEGPFNAAANDIWCLGVCLFMMLGGCAPFKKAHHLDKSYGMIMAGDIRLCLSQWRKLEYFDEDALDLIDSIFQFEEERISLEQIKQHQWLKN